MGIDKMISLILAIILAISPCVHADSNPDFMTAAESAVDENHRAAKAFVDGMVQEDFYRIVQSLNFNVLETARHINNAAELPGRMVDLSKEFDLIAQMDERDLARTEQKLKEAFSRYQELVRTRFDWSWLPSSMAQSYQTLAPSLKFVLSNYENTCRNGHSDLRFSSGLPAMPNLPNLDFSIYVGYRGDGQNTSGYEISYQQNNYTTDEIKKLNNSMLVSAGVGGMATSFYFAGAQATAQGFGVTEATAANTFLPAYAAVAWVALAVVVVLAVIASRKAAREKFRMVEAQHNAMVYMANNIKVSSDLSEMYKNECDANINILKRVIDFVSQIEASPKQKMTIVSQYLARETAIKAFEQKYASAQAAGCRVELFNIFKEGKCNDDKICKVSGDQVLVPGGSCQISVNYDETSKKIDAKAYNFVLSDKETDAKVVDLVLYRLADLFGRNYDTSLQAIHKASEIGIADQQRKAFNKLKMALHIRQKILMGNSAVDRALIAELHIGKAYDQFKSRFLDILAQSFKVIFNQAPMSVAKSAFLTWDAEYSEFAATYRHVDEVSALEEAGKKLAMVMGY